MLIRVENLSPVGPTYSWYVLSRQNEQTREKNCLSYENVERSIP